MDRNKIEVGGEYIADLWGKKAKIRVLKVIAETHKTVAGKQVERHFFYVEKGGGGKR